jgi:trans-2,3-dihydro-3-hydroxyanthranilate isomerase
VPIASLDTMAKARVNSQHWGSVITGHGLVGAFLYCRETVHTSSSFHARMFAPDMGIPEDPATGSAVVAFAGPIHRFDAPPDGLHKRIIEQGFEMGRPSLIALSLEIERSRLMTVRIGGHAVRVTEGHIKI